MTALDARALATRPDASAQRRHRARRIDRNAVPLDRPSDPLSCCDEHVARKATVPLCAERRTRCSTLGDSQYLPMLKHRRLDQRGAA